MYSRIQVYGMTEELSDSPLLHGMRGGSTLLFSVAEASSYGPSPRPLVLSTRQTQFRDHNQADPATRIGIADSRFLHWQFGTRQS